MQFIEEVCHVSVEFIRIFDVAEVCRLLNNSHFRPTDPTAHLLRCGQGKSVLFTNQNGCGNLHRQQGNSSVGRRESEVRRRCQATN